MADEVRSKLRDVIVGALSVRDFDAWLSDASWNAHRLAEPNARRMIRQAQMRLIEYFNSDAQRKPDELVRDLASILNNIVVSQAVDVSSDEQRYFEFASSPSAGPAYPLVAA